MSKRTLNRINKLESEGKFIEAEVIRKLEAQRGRRSKKNATGEDITKEILNKVKEAVSEILTEYNLPTAIYFIEKSIDSSIKSLEGALVKSIQEVLDNVNKK